MGILTLEDIIIYYRNKNTWDVLIEFLEEYGYAHVSLRAFQSEDRTMQKHDMRTCGFLLDNRERLEEQAEKDYKEFNRMRPGLLDFKIYCKIFRYFLRKRRDVDDTGLKIRI